MMTIPTEFRDAHAAWFDARMARLTAEDGWLNLLGRWWISPGVRTIGSGADNDIQVPVGPEVLGRLTLNSDDTGLFEPAGGEPIALSKKAGTFTWRSDRFLLEIMSINDLRALRIRDTQSEAASRMKPIAFFPIVPGLRITAHWQRLTDPMRLTVDTIIGVPTQVSVTRVAKFELGGRQMAMLPTHGTVERPMFVFRDLTSLDDTYARMRFILGEEVTESEIVIDFNRAINPPCAFTPYAACPLPPRENLFSVRIEAGERRP